jgi:hypothetical protein
MRRRLLVIGSLVVVAMAAASYWSAQWITAEEIAFTSGLRAPNGRPGFAFILNSWAWWAVSGGSAAHWQTLLPTDHADLHLTAIINHGLATSAHNCPDRWLLAQVHPLPNGSIFISGYCASEAELGRAGGNVTVGGGQ